MKKYSKPKAIDYCCRNGLKFVGLFKQLFDTKNKDRQPEILNKMQIIFDKINDIYITKSQNLIYHSQKMDWFYTATSNYDNFFDNNKDIELYDKFVLLVEVNNNVKTSLLKLGLL